MQKLSNLRIHENFNCALCQEVTRTCLRVGAIDYGLNLNPSYLILFVLFFPLESLGEGRLQLGFRSPMGYI